MMLHAKNYLNQPMFYRVIQKITMAQLFGTELNKNRESV